jgi:hypothetical protein
VVPALAGAPSELDGALDMGSIDEENCVAKDKNYLMKEVNYDDK